MPCKPLKNVVNLVFGRSFSRTTSTDLPELDFAKTRDTSAKTNAANTSQRAMFAGLWQTQAGVVLTM